MATVTTKPSLTIKRRFNAPPAKVFAAWTDPEKLKHWMGGREIGSVTAETNDACRRPFPNRNAEVQRRRTTRRQRRLP